MVKFLIRSFIFLSLLCSLAFSKNCAGSGLCLAVLDRNLDSSFKPIDGKFLKGNHFGFRSPEYGYYFIYSFIIRDEAYYFAGSHKPGFYKGFGNDYSYIHSIPKSGRFGQRGGVGDYEYYVVSDYPKDPVFTYYDFILFNSKQIAKCSLNQEFNTDTMQCVDACPAGQAWDVDINACANDCTDKNLNKFGFFNGTTQGKCVDCSNVYSDRDIATCLCTGLGSSFGGSVVFVSDTENPSIVRSSCVDGTSIIFKRRSDEDPNKDKDKDKEDPNKDKDKDKEDPNKDKDKDKDKDNNSSTPGNGNNNGSSGGNNNGSGGNNGGSGGGSSGGTGGGSSGGTGGGSSGGNNQGNNGQGGGQGNNGNSENATPGNINYGELEERTADLANMYKENINNLFEPIDGIKKSLNDTISKIKDGNLMSLKKGGIPNTCPLNFEFDLITTKKEIIFDLCKILSPVSHSLYLFFYIAFFLLFLALIVKLFIFTFMGW